MSRRELCGIENLAGSGWTTGKLRTIPRGDTFLMKIARR
jgi:hypothetical protein